MNDGDKATILFDAASEAVQEIEEALGEWLSVEVDYQPDWMHVCLKRTLDILTQGINEVSDEGD